MFRGIRWVGTDTIAKTGVALAAQCGPGLRMHIDRGLNGMCFRSFIDRGRGRSWQYQAVRKAI